MWAETFQYAMQCSPSARASGGPWKNCDARDPDQAARCAGQLESSPVSHPINLIDDVDISDLRPVQRSKTPGTMCRRYPTIGPETRE